MNECVVEAEHLTDLDENHDVIESNYVLIQDKSVGDVLVQNPEALLQVLHVVLDCLGHFVLLVVLKRVNWLQNHGVEQVIRVGS